MRGRWVAALLIAGSLGLATSPAEAEVTWLCRPDMADSPCELPTDTTYQERGKPSSVETPAVGPRDVDCFYVYPTVSNQTTANADKTRDPELDSIAQYQAARFGRHCRMFAPIYRQATLGSIAANAVVKPDRQIAYADVREAFAEYLERDSGGRGFVLLGHSQGTGMLRRLIRDVVDPDAGLRRRLVGAVLLGGNVSVAEGKLSGGDFQNVSLCTTRAQLGCVVAFSTYFEDPPSGSRFGRNQKPTDMSGLAGGPGFEVACTDPRPLAGDDAPLRILVPSRPFAPGLLSLGVLVQSNGNVPQAATTWVSPPDRAEGRCAYRNGANVLRLDPVGPGSRRPTPYPDPTWGTHVLDVNLALDPLVSLVGQQAERYVRPQVLLSARCVKGRARYRAAGRDAELVTRLSKVTRRGSRVRVTATLGASAKQRLTLTRRVRRC